MSLVQFEMPDELKQLTYNKILQGMLDKIPDNVDKTEGGWVWDMVAPAALEAAELVQFWLVLALKNSFHMWATGRWLDYCAYDCGLERKAATNAYGDVVVTTNRPNLTFKKGFVFSVPSENGSVAIDFETTKTHICATAGEYTFRVKAVLTGTDSNVKADTITIMKNPIKGVAGITNPEPMSGGAEPESDADLRQRIDDYFAGRMASFVGNKKDYVRWAKEIDGVGYAICIPNYAGVNTVKLIVADMSGEPANQEIINDVELHIFGTGHDDINRLAPIGVAQYEVVAPEYSTVNYSFKAELENGYTLEQIKSSFKENLVAFYKTLPDADNIYGVLKLTDVADVVYHTEGIDDFKNLKINGQAANIDFGYDKIPVTGTVSITLYEDEDDDF